MTNQKMTEARAAELADQLERRAELGRELQVVDGGKLDGTVSGRDLLRRGPGRPRLPEAERRTQMIRFRLTSEERDRLDAVATERDLTRSELLRQLVQQLNEAS